jgi:hypothetical protein
MVSMDSDLSHDLCYLPEMLKAAEEADLVLGSRLIDGGRIEGRSFWRDSLSVVTNGVIRLVTGEEIFDWTSGLRVYRRLSGRTSCPPSTATSGTSSSRASTRRSRGGTVSARCP